MNKRTIIILGIIILLSFTAGGILLAGRKKSLTPAQESAETQIKKFVDEAVVSPVASFDGNALWYFTPAGRLFRINADGFSLTEFPLPATTPIGTLSKVLWPKEGSDFIAFVTTNLGEVKSYYDSAQNKYVTLPENTQSLDWMPDSKRIVYVWKSGDGKQQLKMSGADSTGFTALADVFWDDYAVKVSPTGNDVLLYRSKPEGPINKIYKFNLQSRQFETVVESGKNSAAVWLPGGEKFLFVEASNALPRMFMYNFSSNKITDLNLAASVDKVALDAEKKLLYAAVADKDNTGDEFVTLDLSSLKQGSYYQPAESVRAKNLLEVQGKLYFVNVSDNKLYYIVK